MEHDDNFNAWASAENELGELKEKYESLQSELKTLKAENGELKDFAFWMTGCGYDFCQHEYFCKKRDKLLKGDKNA